MENSWNMKNWQKDFTFGFYQICAFSVQKFSISLESLHFPNFFHKMSQMQNLSREKIMENREMVVKNLIHG